MAIVAGYTIEDYIREKRLSSEDMLVPLSHHSGQAQADFGEAKALVDGVKRKIHSLFSISPPSK
ncbi:MAG: hypothetical protein VB778_06915 [Nitrospinaceae bacterium]